MVPVGEFASHDAIFIESLALEHLKRPTILKCREEPANLTDCHSVNRLFKVTKFPPPKTEVLGYIDNGGQKPARYAEAMIILAPFDIMHYKVGPLPLVEGEVEVTAVT